MIPRAALSFLLLIACTSAQHSDDTEESDTEERETAPVDDRVFVQVNHEREFRGVWVATVWNINFPTRQTLSVDEQKAELDALVAAVSGANGNALLFQVRPEGDALYASELEPWSRWLTGTQGEDPGYDPLAYLIEVAHNQNIEVHAWLNPYRAASSKNAALADNHWAKRFPDVAYTYGNYLWMDPGSEEVRAHTIAVCTDLANRYAIDGIHFDDYFYPYPTENDFPDQTLYKAYVASGGTMDLGDWRRNNVHLLVQGVHDALTPYPGVRFGIGPFGIYRPGYPSGIKGLDAYAAIYADPLPWLENQWVDYLAPQLYWPSTQTAQAYGPLVEWWGQQANGAWIFPGNYLAKLDSSSAWSTEEFRTQFDLTREQRAAGVHGNVLYHIGPLLENQSGIQDTFAQELWKSPVLTPTLAHIDATVTPAPWLERQDRSLHLTAEETLDLRAWTVYEKDSEALWQLYDIIPKTTTTIELPSGTWAIAAVSTQGIESEGVMVEVP